MFSKKLKKGFTLIEVLIAVTIIGIMSSLTVLSYKNYISVTNEAATKEELSYIIAGYINILQALWITLDISKN